MASALAIPASAAGFSSCWVTQTTDPFTGEIDQVTRCRVSGGGETIDYASDSSVPSVLYPNLGTDVTGQCWYYTSAVTDYVIINQFADGRAEMGLDTGAIIALGPTVPRCTSEPAPAADPEADAWDYVMSYVHDPPTPDLNPAVGEGITGLDTFVGVEVPPEHAATLTSGASTLEVEIVVDAVVVSWGDGTTDTFPPMETVLAGYPDGSATHLYEAKEPDGATITVEYDWTARWRLVGGTWDALPVPNTSTSLDYPIAEVVSRLSE